MNIDDLINYGKNHGDSKVRELAEVFEEYRTKVLAFTNKKNRQEKQSVGLLRAKVMLNQTYGRFAAQSSGEREPIRDPWREDLEEYKQ